MTRDELFTQVHQALGWVPQWLEDMPEHEAEEVWAAIRGLLLEGVTLTPREKALICLAVGIAQGCPPVASLGSAAARGSGTSLGEVLEARRVAETVVGLGSYFKADGSFDYYRFEGDILRAAAFTRAAMNVA